MADIDEDLHETVRSIVDELEAVASGSLYEVDGDYRRNLTITTRSRRNILHKHLPLPR